MIIQLLNSGSTSQLSSFQICSKNVLFLQIFCVCVFTQIYKYYQDLCVGMIEFRIHKMFYD